MAEKLDATFFTLKRRDRAVLAPVTLIYLLLMAALIGVFVAINWGAFGGFVEFARQGAAGQQPSDEAGMSMLRGMMALMLTGFLFLFPGYILTAAYEAACLRWLIRGEAPGWFGLSLDHDAWRVYGVYWCWFLTQLVVSFAMSLLLMPVMVATMGEAFGSASPDPDALMRWQLSVQLPLTLLQYVPLIFIGVRLGPAAATSIARRRFSFFEAWTVTRDRFWALFGSFFVLALLAGILAALILGGAYAWAFGSFWGDIAGSWPQIPAEVGEAIVARMFSTPVLTALGGAYAAYFVVFLAYVVMTYGVNARAALAAIEDGKIEPYVETA